jgi:hypothetical protein
MLGIQVTAVMMVIIALLSLVVIAVLRGGFDWWTTKVDPNFQQIFISGTIAGIMGAVISISHKTFTLDFEENIPNIRIIRIFTFLRAAYGAVMAFPILLLGYSSFLALDVKKPWLLVAGCFVGGFSERFLVDRLEKVASVLTKEKKAQ